MELPIIDVQNISKDYSKKERRVEVIRNISFSIGTGQVVAIVGPSGCGKTTILKMICGLIKPDVGYIKYKGGDISYALDNALIGYIPQSPSLLPFRTVRENIQLPFEILQIKDRSRIDELISICGLQKFVNYYPYQLSGGMSQKVAIARTLAYHPAILLMDEPMASLDELIKEKLNEELLKIRESTNATFIYVTHNIEEAVFLSNKIVILSNSPGTVINIVDILLPKKRDSLLRSTEAFFHEVIKVRKLLQKT